MKFANVLVLAGVFSIAYANTTPSDAYFLSPKEKILCSIHSPNADGSRDAVGTDLSNPSNIMMETVRISANGISNTSWVIDRANQETREGGYNVFRTHCAPLMKNVPVDVSAKFVVFFAN